MAVFKEVRTGDDAVAERRRYRPNILAELIYVAGGVIIALLAIRFLLVLFGANPGNGFADFIYTVSHPFAAPFFGLFSYHENLGTGGRFEYELLIAIVVYAIVMELLARLVSVGSRRPRA
jgi:hypothetical protein